jgi:hypothetical protein
MNSILNNKMNNFDSEINTSVKDDYKNKNTMRYT